MKKIKFTPELVCAVLFLIVIFLFGSITLVQRIVSIGESLTKPFKNADSKSAMELYSDVHQSFTKELEVESFTENLWNRLWFIDIYSVAQRATLALVNEDESETVVKDNHGYLHFVEPRLEAQTIEKYANNLIKLQESVEVPILFVQAPNKKLDGYTQLPKIFDNYSNDNADDFLSLIEGKVDYLDLRDEVDKSFTDKSQLFYITDHHWTTETAFWGYQKTAEKIKENYGIDLDPQGIYTDINNYEALEYPKSFLGAQGRRVGRYYTDIDDYTLLLPKFNTSFVTSEVLRPSGREPIRNVVGEGDFRQALIDEEILSSTDITANKHGAYLSIDRGEQLIVNNLNPNGKKVVIIKDSFAMPYSCFMATGTAETTILDMRYFSFVNRDIAAYINEYSPDVVIFLYNTEAYTNDMFVF